MKLTRRLTLCSHAPTLSRLLLPCPITLLLRPAPNPTSLASFSPLQTPTYTRRRHTPFHDIYSARVYAAYHGANITASKSIRGKSHALATAEQFGRYVDYQPTCARL